MIDVLLLDACDSWPRQIALLTLFALMSCAIIYRTPQRQPDPLNHLPRYEVAVAGTLEHQFPTAEALLRYAYTKHSDSPFVVGGSWRRWDTVILPPKTFDSIKSLSEDSLSFYDALDTRFLHHLTTIKVPEEGGDTPILKALAIDLPRHLKNHVADIAEESEYAFAAILPKCDDDWVEVYPMQVLPRILALVSGRIFMGHPLSRNPDFLNLKLGFFRNSFIAMTVLSMVPASLRSLVARILPPVKGLKTAHLEMQRIMKPIIEQRKIDQSQGKEAKSDLLGWVINNTPEHLKYNVRYQSHAQLITGVASVQSLYVATAHLWFDIAAHPGHVGPLRDEWKTLIREDPAGQVSFETMLKAWKLDSFVKESARCNPSQLTATEYVSRREIVLKDGTVLPKGTYMGTASSQLGNDARLWSSPEVFDGFRYAKLRSQPGNEGKFHFTATGLDQLSFGYGRHPCPGRYYASHVIKTMLAILIDTYEIKLPDGASRPKNLENWIAFKPNDKVPILLRKRREPHGSEE
ncbi:cytochrome p450 like protein [Zymoseptoria brevis]|uniref:Cytochrome p450 like protein n=1 Tax=Zymoseptoria brevis TaxID=1047168 RepID=A0A0F4GKG5_9PEZI|nr:cytochrome p450 like protein [Zymoseptoria brevis]